MVGEEDWGSWENNNDEEKWTETLGVMKKIGEDFVFMVSICGAHSWQLSNLWDIGVPCSAHASKRTVGMVPTLTQQALVKPPLLTKHRPQMGGSNQRIYRLEACWFKNLERQTIIHTHLIEPHSKTSTHTFTKTIAPPSISFFSLFLGPTPYSSGFSHIHAEVSGADEKQR